MYIYHQKTILKFLFQFNLNFLIFFSDIYYYSMNWYVKFDIENYLMLCDKYMFMSWS